MEYPLAIDIAQTVYKLHKDALDLEPPVGLDK